MEKKEKIFADGIIAKRRDDAKDFLICNLSLKEEEIIAFIKKHSKNGWVNLDVKRGRSGNLYVELDTFEPRKAASKPKVAEPDELLF